MDLTERDRLASALIAHRPDWANTGVDRIKRVRTWLSENAMEWPYLDATIRMTVCALDPKTETPARALSDGPWKTMLRHTAGSAVSDQPLTIEARGADCQTCGIPKGEHAGVRTLIGFEGEPLEPHDWTPTAPSTTPASPATIARAKSAALSTKETEPMNAPSEAGERLPGHEDRDSAQVDPDAFVRVTPSAFHDASQA